MVRKEASKGREWEKGRRDILNQTFLELHKALPSYDEGKTISKKTILIQALEFIHELQQSAKVEDNKHEGSQSKLIILQDWVQSILQKLCELLSYLTTINVEVPPEFLLLEAPPVWIKCEISKLVSTIGKISLRNVHSLQKHDINQKQKSTRRRRGDTSNDDISLITDGVKCGSPKKFARSDGDKEVPCYVKSDLKTGLVSNSPIISSTPFVVQSPSQLQLPSPLLFTSNTSAVSPSLPLLVSVSNVKSVNPFILVQSSSSTSNPIGVQKILCNRKSVRPIQPGPPSNVAKKSKKIPIPSLKSRCAIRKAQGNILNGKSLPKAFDGIIPSHSVRMNGEKKSRKRKIKLVKPVRDSCSPANTSKEADENCKGKVGTERAVSTEGKGDHVVSNNAERVHAAGIHEEEKENASDKTLSENQKGGGPDQCSGASTSSKAVTNSEDMNDATENVKESSADAGSQQRKLVGSYIVNDETEIENILYLKDDAILKKRLFEKGIGDERSRRQKYDTGKVDSDHLKSDDDGSPEGSSQVKSSNYSISAICAEQHLLQNTEVPLQTCETTLEQEVSIHEKTTAVDHTKGASVSVELSVTEGKSKGKASHGCCNSDTSRDLLPSDMFSEWSDRNKLKSDKICPSYNAPLSAAVHNSKNTFTPINDIDAFKAVPESFDPTDGSFGLPLHPSDISGDIFASLHVPAGGQHSESISPTAAFLLAFPIVSTSKASELLSDEAVGDNNDSQPGMKTILQIGNLDCDTPVTKCVSVYPSIDNNNTVFTASNIFNQDAFSFPATGTTTTPTVTNRKAFNLPPNSGNYIHKDIAESNAGKCADDNNLMHKMYEPSLSVKNSQSFFSKSNYQPSCSDNNQCRNQNTSSRVPSPSPGQLGISSSQLKTVSELTVNAGKASSKLDHPQDSTSYGNCQKQTDWMDMSHVAFTDFPLNVSRSDCAVNFGLPTVSMSSNTNGEELISMSKSQVPPPPSASGILAWSTIPNNVQRPKIPSKPSQVQNICPPKSSGKSTGVQHLISDNSTAVLVSGDDKVVSSPSHAAAKLDSVSSTCNLTTSIANSGNTIMNTKENELINCPVPTLSDLERKKSISNSSEGKQTDCHSPGQTKSLSNATSGVSFVHQIRQVFTESSAIYVSPGEKQMKQSGNSCYGGRSVIQNVKDNTTTTSTVDQNLKETLNSLHYDHNNAIQSGKTAHNLSGYNNVPSSNVKSVSEQDPITVNYYAHHNHLLKDHFAINTSYSTGITVSSNTTELKKNEPDSNHSNLEVSKQPSTGLICSLQNVPSMQQHDSNSVNQLDSQQEVFNSPSNRIPKTNESDDQLTKSQVVQLREQLSRTTNKETVTNLHRPPVNWMTGPDIRSHQHHGPSFGNSSSNSGSQGLLYLPDHSKDLENSVYDQSGNFHCLDLQHSGQPIFKNNDLHLFGTENVDCFHDNTAWSPSKSGGSSMLGNMIIPSTLPTLVGDLALGDNNISRPFLPPFSSDSQSAQKKSAKRVLNSTRRSSGKIVQETDISAGTTQECSGSFLSVSQLVDSSSKSRILPTSKENAAYSVPLTDHEAVTCNGLKQSSPKQVSSNYSTEALLSSSNAHRVEQLPHRKRRSLGTHFSNNYSAGTIPYQNSTTMPLQAQGHQTQYLPDLPRGNEFQGPFLHSESVPTFMLSNPPRSHRNHGYALQNITDRSSIEDSPNALRNNPAAMSDTTGRHRISNNSSAATSSSVEFSYMSMPPSLIQEDINYSNHPTHHPTLLSHHSYPIPTAQDTLYSATRLSMHSTQSSSMQSPSATTLTNFHLSTIFPEINEKVIC